MRLLLFAILLAPLPAFAQAKKPEVPNPKPLRFNFDSSKIFPGTTRNVTVYVPTEYDGTTPACVHVNQDGVQFNAPAVFDTLIAAKEMPITIGIFVTPGVVKATDPKTALDRFNRSYEYDGLGDAYARFLLEELLPFVETKSMPDGRKIVLSKKGNDRAIAGTSSGAIAAFTAAWERPDAFSRVISGIGTYVGLRGGNVYPTLIRKVEPKPLRIFLQDGSKDQDIYGGDWWMANQEMERSLKFAGYEVNHEWGDEGHSGNHLTKIFPEAVKWLWKDWPEPVKAGAGSSQLKEILIPGEGWKLVGEGYKFTEGAAVNAAGEVYFNAPGSSKTYKVGADGKPAIFLENSNGGDGQAFGPDGRLYSVASKVDKIIAYDAAGGGTEIASGFKGNDIVVLNNGNMYVTFPGWDGKSPSKVIFINSKGEKKDVDSGLRFSNGITISPDQTLLYVADSRTHWVWSYQIQPDGTLKHKQKYYHLHVRDVEDESGADGMRCDTAGRLWVATKMGLQVCDQAGRVNGIIPTPNGKISNLCFGGKDFDVLYATCGDAVFSRKVKAKGVQAYLPPMKPAAPRL